MSENHEQFHAIIVGRVQGVSFRYYTVQKAQELQLVGWVMNRQDGQSVEVVAEGNRERLETLYAWLHQGSPAARVEKVIVEWGIASREFTEFRTRYWHE